MTDRFESPNRWRRPGKIHFPAFLAMLLLLNPLLPRSLAQRLSPLEKKPDWSQLDRFQETISREDFVRLLDSVYAPRDAWKQSIQVGEKAAQIRKTFQPSAFYSLRFGESHPVPRYWRPVAEIPADGTGGPLSGARIAIDPGHLGGKWARVEERWFKIGDGTPVTEGDMTLLVARKLAAKLEASGAKVYLVRRDANPVTSDRPRDLEPAARTDLNARGVSPVNRQYNGPADPSRFSSIEWQSELLFYRASEIRARGRLVNEKIRPDLTLCLHLNAEAWGDPNRPDLTDQSHMHFLVNGCYEAAELRYDDVRFGMVEQLLSRTAEESIAISEVAATTLAQATGLPAYQYSGSNAYPVGRSGYVWARNLLANRLYLCPVVYAEPYVMNSRRDYARIQMGDYKGQRLVGTEMRSSIFEEYATGLHAGLVRYFQTVRR